jgi:hypothetical protein
MSFFFNYASIVFIERYIDVLQQPNAVVTMETDGSAATVLYL